MINNIVNKYLESKSPFNRFENLIKNCIFLLSLSKLTKEEVDDVLEVIKRIVSQGNNSMGMFQSINFFLGVQYNLYNLEIEENILLGIIEDLINKVVYKNFNAYEYHVLTRNQLSNLYGYARERKAVLTNNKLIDKLLHEIDNYDISEKIEICQNFVLKLYEIANEEIKDKIKSYIISIDSSEEKELFKKIIFDLTLVIYDFKELDENSINELNDYLEQFKDGKTFSSVLYMIDGQIDFLKENKKEIDSLNEISKVLKEVLEKYKASDRMSIF